MYVLFCNSFRIMQVPFERSHSGKILASLHQHVQLPVLTFFSYTSIVILDSLTEVELSNIAKKLLPLTNTEVIEFAQALQFGDLEIERVMKKSSDNFDRLLSLLRGFKRRGPATQYGTRRCLAIALMEWGHNISLALRLYPKRKSF